MVCVVCGWWARGCTDRQPRPRSPADSTRFERGKPPAAAIASQHEQLPAYRLNRRAGEQSGGRSSGYGSLCRSCAGSLREAGEVRLESGLMVGSLFLHEGPVRAAVHALKYHGTDRVARVLAPRMAALLPGDASALVPVPRSVFRRLRFGVDAGRLLAREVARSAGLPVADVLRAPVHHRSQLRLRRSDGLRFRLVDRPPSRAVLIDDVLTTGATLAAAAAACRGGITRAVTITRSPVTAPVGPALHRSGRRSLPEPARVNA